MIKTIGAAIKRPTNRSLADFQSYWAEHHGPFFSHTPHLRRYVQGITLTEAYGGHPAPTHNGVSMFWYDDLDSIVHPPSRPKLSEAIPALHSDVYEAVQRSRHHDSRRNCRPGRRSTV